MKAGVIQDSLHGPNIFLFYIDDMSKNILRYLMNIYADDAMAYGKNSQDLNVQKLALDLSADLVLTAQ